MANASRNSMTEGTVQQGQNHDRKGSGRGLGRPWIVPLFVTLLSISATPAFAANVKYCSNTNTGSDFDSVVSIYQSHGACTTTCQGKYAFAIVQGNTCWCSNYAPADNSASCNEDCPGYPAEKCGDTQKDVYGYVALAMKPSGTKGATSTTPTVSTTSSSIRDSTPPPVAPSLVTTVSVVTKEKEGSVETVTTISTVQPTTATKDDKPSQTSASVPSTTATRQDGKTTITAKPTGGLSSADPSSSSTPSKSGISGGTIAGIVIGVIAAILLLIGALLLWRRRNRAAAMDSESPNEKIAAGGAGMIGGTGRKSALGLAGTGAKSPNGTSDGSHITPTSSTEGEVPYDPRLDPHSLFARYDQTTGSSRMSVRSLRDDADYSRRVLRLANPDTDE